MKNKAGKKARKPFISNLERTRKEHSKNSVISIVIAAIFIIFVVVIVELGFFV